VRRKRDANTRKEERREENKKRRSPHQRAVDVRDDAAAGDRGLDERIELLVSADGELQVAGRDALDLEVLGRVARQLEHLGGQVLCCFCLFFVWCVRLFRCVLLCFVVVGGGVVVVFA